MDSLRVLQDSLDSSRHPPVPSQKHAKALNNEFKAAAFHLTNLYRGAQASSQHSYRAGYLHALKDIVDLVRMRSIQNVNAGGEMNVFDESEGEFGNAEAGSSRGHSQSELRFLARYLQARIEAIKSESDEEDADSGSGAGAGAGSADNAQRGQPSRHQQPHSSIRQRMEDWSQSPVASTAPGTPAHRITRMPSSSSASDNLDMARTPTRSGVPSSSSFVFNLPSRSGMNVPSFSSSDPSRDPTMASSSSSPLPYSSPSSAIASSSSPAPSPQLRRRHRTLSSHAASAVASSSSPERPPAAATTTAAALATVPEETATQGGVALGGSDSMDVAEDDDEGAREERGNGTGRRGPPVYNRSLAEERPKRRRKTTAEKIALAAAAATATAQRRHHGGGSSGGDDGAV